MNSKLNNNTNTYNKVIISNNRESISINKTYKLSCSNNNNKNLRNSSIKKPINNVHI